MGLQGKILYYDNIIIENLMEKMGRVYYEAE